MRTGLEVKIVSQLQDIAPSCGVTWLHGGVRNKQLWQGVVPKPNFRLLHKECVRLYGWKG